MSAYQPCPSCGEEITEDSDFCPHCGTVFENAPSIPCDDHSQKTAVAVCIICRKLLCEECAHVKSGRRFCLEHRSVKVEQDWALLYQSADVNEAELARSFLESINQRMVTRNFQAQGSIWDGGGDSLVSRQVLNSPAKIFVPIPDYVQAKRSLDEWKSAE